MNRVGLLAIAMLGLAAAPAAQPQDRPTFGAATSAVVVDVVVRDRQGRPITDLAIKDFQLLEDGVAQEIGALSMVAPEVAGVTDEERRVYNTGISKEAAAATIERTQSEGDAPPGHTIVAILFENLSPENRRDAIRAASVYLDTPERPGDLVGVFSAGLALSTVSTFTNDRTALRKALDAAAMQGNAREIDTRGLGTAGAEVRGAAGTGGIDPRVNALADVEAGINEAFRDLTNQQRAHGVLDGLNAMVAGLARLPGRKTIIYFSEGLTLRAGQATDGLVHRFNQLVARANASNVAVYPIDAMGLRVHSQQMMHGAEIQNASRAMLNGPDGGGMSIVLDPNNILEGGNTSHVFGRLAKETGGFVIESTNDLAAGFRRVDADRRFHYLLTYTPRKTDFGGEYRKIEVKVNRRDAVVRARSGYRADRALATIPTQRYEAVAAAALAATPRPADIPIEARALRMPAADDAGRVAVLARVPARGITFQGDPILGRYRTDAVVLVRILDESGAVVRKASQPYRLDGPLADRDRAAQGDLLFFRQPTLPPGRYTLEYAVVDAFSNRAGTGSAPLDIVEPAPSMLMAGDLVVAQRAEAVTAGEVEANHALLVGGEVLLYPNLGEPLRADQPQTVTLYAVVRPAAGRPDITATLAVVRDRQTVVTAPVTMSAPGADGFIKQLVRLPLPALAAGEYTVRLELTDGQNRGSRYARLTLAR
jgi:VWFA-related protein